jgi:hypothetical protein
MPGSDKVGQVGSELVVCLIVIALDGDLLEGAVHPLDLAVGPRVIGFGRAVPDAVAWQIWSKLWTRWRRVQPSRLGGKLMFELLGFTARTLMRARRR